MRRLSHRAGMLSGAALLLAALVSPAEAAPPSLEDRVEQGVACYRALDFGCAIETLQRTLLDAQTGAPLSEKAELRARLHLAFALVAVDRMDDARAHLRRVLAIDPRFSLDPSIVSPRIASTLEEVRKELLAQAVPQQLDPGAPIALEARPEPPPSLLMEAVITRDSTGMPGEGESFAWTADLGAGATFLTGADADRYGIGPGLLARVLYRFDDIWVVGLGSGMSMHSVADLDLGANAPNSLWILRIDPQIGVSVPVAAWLSVEARAVVGAVVFGHDGLSGGAGIEAALAAGLRLRASQTLSIVLEASPTIASGSAGDATGTSVSIPVMLMAGFGF